MCARDKVHMADKHDKSLRMVNTKSEILDARSYTTYLQGFFRFNPIDDSPLLAVGRFIFFADRWYLVGRQGFEPWTNQLGVLPATGFWLAHSF